MWPETEVQVFSKGKVRLVIENDSCLGLRIDPKDDRVAKKSTRIYDRCWYASTVFPIPGS